MPNADRPTFSPAVQQSGKGGTFVLPTTNITEAGGEFGTIAAGAPYFGSDAQNSDLCEWPHLTGNSQGQVGLTGCRRNSLLQRDACGLSTSL